MKIKIGQERIKILILKNNYSYDKNLSYVLIDQEWYSCNLLPSKKGSKYFIKIVEISKRQSNEKYLKGNLQNEVIRVSRLKLLIIKGLLNIPSFDYFSRILKKRRNGVIITIVAFISTFYFYFYNSSNENKLIEFISKNLWCQTIIVFLTISSFINIFFPFTLHKETTKEDVEEIANEISKQTTINKKNREEQIKRLIN